MKHKAYQIVNFKDPISVRYFEHSQKSLQPVRDVLDIEPIQCVLPEEVESYNFPFKNTGRYSSRSITEKACLLSHYNLVKKLYRGEKFFVLEHDVYLWPERIEIFYYLLENSSRYTIFFPGISNEFYTMTKPAAFSYLNIAVNKNDWYGPLAFSFKVMEELASKPDSFFLWPVNTLKNHIAQGKIPTDLLTGNDCIIYDSPITQHYNLPVGSTIKNKASKWKVSREKNPNFYFTEEEWT